MLILKNHDQSNKKSKFLIIEDEKTSQESMKLALTHIFKFTCEIHLAGTGEGGIEIANNYLFDLIFINVGLPGTNGVAVAEIIRQTEGKNKHTPIIVTSGNPQEKKRCLEVGIDTFLVKPFTVAELTRILKKFGFFTEI
jgi:two-component system sensor histidine kinase BarA